MALIKLNNQSLTAVTSLPAAIPTGKIGQVVRSVLSTTTYTTGTTSTSIFSGSITPSATSSYIYAIFTANYRMSCNDNTSNPYGNIRLKVGGSTGSTKADMRLRDINSAGATNIDRDFIGEGSAYWTPNSTSAQALHVCVEMGTATGRIGLYGNNDHTNATSLTLMEILA